MSMLLKGMVILSPVFSLNPQFSKVVRFKIERPAGSYQKIVEWQEDSFYCLMYKTPLFRKKGVQKGEVFLLKNKRAGCSLNGEVTERVSQIDELNIQNIKKVAGLHFDLVLKYGEEEKRSTYKFPFLNKEKSRWKSFYPIVNGHNEEKPSINALKRGDICLQRKEDCSAFKASTCDLCPDEQFTPFIDLRCSQKISAQCGSYQCGGKGQKACLKMTMLKPANTCEDIKPFVFCQYGLEIECQSNGEVTCR